MLVQLAVAIALGAKNLAEAEALQAHQGLFGEAVPDSTTRRTLAGIDGQTRVALDRARAKARRQVWSLLQWSRGRRCMSVVRGAVMVMSSGTMRAARVTPLAMRQQRPRAMLRTAAAEYPVVVLDTSAVSFGNSTFLNLVLAIYQHTALRIARPPAQVFELMRMTGTNQILCL